MISMIFLLVHVAWYSGVLQARGKMRFPVSDGLIREHRTTFHKHLRQVAQASGEPQSPEDDEEHDSGGGVQKKEFRV